MPTLLAQESMSIQVLLPWQKTLQSLYLEIGKSYLARSINTNQPKLMKRYTRSHMLIIVKIDGEEYVVDANFGPNAPINPVPLRDGYEFDDFDGRRGKICTAPISQNKAKHLKYWHIQLREKEQAPWITSYIFNEQEFLDGDYQALERSFRANKRSWFLYKVMAFKFVLDRSTRKPVGWVLLWENHIKEKMNGKFHFKTIQSESERIDLLEEKFGIVLEDEEKREIIGTLACMPKIDADSQPKQIKDDTASVTRARL